MTDYKYKQVIVVRTDIKMSKGKLATQVSHASVSSFYKALRYKPIIAKEWLKNKQPKIVLKVDSLDELMRLKDKAEKLGLIYEIIRDAGLTELPPGTITCIGIGPDDKDNIDEVTGKLPLL